MNSKFIILFVALVSTATGFVLYNSSPNQAEEINLAAGAQYEETAAVSDQYGIPGDILYTKPVETVTFSHKTHAVELEYKCNTCHSGIFQMKANTVQSKPDFNMEGLADGKYCGSCHSAEHDVAFPTSSQCARCHVGVTGLEEETGLEGESLKEKLEADSTANGLEAASGETADQAGNG